ncbi:MAG: L-serine ammonia-lyase, iron-sulfur-dependent subunit beta [Sarcina sp.]
MNRYGVFDVIGPIMVGPSSSHTAAAARLGKIASTICAMPIKKVTFLLHGSFAKTYKGHGTDKALIAGILGMEPSDLRLRDSFKIAKEKGLEVEFVETSLGENIHPNTVRFIMETKEGSTVEVMGSSIGGGAIKITEVEGCAVEFTGQYPTLIISNKDIPGSISAITNIIYEHNINVASLKVYRVKRGESASMLFELDNNLPKEALSQIKAVESVCKAILISPESREV